MEVFYTMRAEDLKESPLFRLQTLSRCEHMPFMDSCPIPTISSPVAHQLRIAFPLREAELCAHFGGASHFRILTAERDSGCIVEQTDLEAPAHIPGAFPKWLAQQGVQAVIAGSIGKRAVQLLIATGIPVYLLEPGATIEQLVKSLVNGKLKQPILEECCSGHGHDHGHEHHGESHCH